MPRSAATAATHRRRARANACRLDCVGHPAGADGAGLLRDLPPRRLPLAIPPAYASPLYPAAGIALASVLVVRLADAGRRSSLGALAANLLLDDAPRAARCRRRRRAAGARPGGERCRPAVGAALVRRFVAPAADADPAARRRRLRGLHAPPAASSAPASRRWRSPRPVVLASAKALVDLGNLVDRRLRRPADRDADRPDADRPAARATGRRAGVAVGLTMTLVVAFLSLGIVQAARWNDERLRGAFEHDAVAARR